MAEFLMGAGVFAVGSLMGYAYAVGAASALRKGE